MGFIVLLLQLLFAPLATENNLVPGNDSVNGTTVVNEGNTGKDKENNKDFIIVNDIYP
jgi:hypothetical protein